MKTSRSFDISCRSLTRRRKKLAWTPSPPGWVCVCTFSKEVKPVHGHDDFSWWWAFGFSGSHFVLAVLLHDLFFSSLTIIHFFQLDTTITAGDARDVGKSGINEDAFLHLWYRDGTPSLRTCLLREWHAHGDLVETLVMRVGFLFSQAVCFIIKEQGTSSFMTSALDALVFVKVCVRVCVELQAFCIFGPNCLLAGRSDALRAMTFDRHKVVMDSTFAAWCEVNIEFAERLFWWSCGC